MVQWGSGQWEGYPSDSLLVLQRWVLWRRGRMSSFCSHLQRPTEDYTVISQVQTSAINWVPELTAGVLLPTTDPLIPDSTHCAVSASNTTALFFKDVFFLCFPLFQIMLTAFFQDMIVFLRVPLRSSCMVEMRFCSCAMRTTSVFWSVKSITVRCARSDASTWAWTKS